MTLWNLNTHSWLLENSQSPWKNTRARAHIWLLTKQNRGTYTKSQDMKRFIIDAIIHCNWTRIWINSLRFTAYLNTTGNKIEELTQSHNLYIAIIHCNWPRIRTNSLRFTAYLITRGNARGNLQEEGCCRKYFQSIIRRLFKKSKMADKVKQK